MLKFFTINWLFFPLWRPVSHPPYEAFKNFCLICSLSFHDIAWFSIDVEVSHKQTPSLILRYLSCIQVCVVWLSRLCHTSPSNPTSAFHLTCWPTSPLFPPTSPLSKNLDWKPYTASFTKSLAILYSMLWQTNNINNNYFKQIKLSVVDATLWGITLPGPG